jgi:2-iminobutanoate/2-iminopropanoate deaminase
MPTRPTHQPINPPTIRKPFASYSHGILVPPGASWLISSGQLGVSPGDDVPDGVEAQCILCFENLRAILEAADMTFADVVRYSGFVTDRSYFPIYGAVRSRYCPSDAYASTLVVVAGFTRPEFKVEVEITAARVMGG